MTGLGRVTELRFEMKLVCDPGRLAQARSWLRLHPAAFVKAYPPRVVNSLYFDTGHLRCLDANLAGDAAREKLRLRWYGEGRGPVAAVLELKQKENLLGRKRRLQLAGRLDLQRPWPDIIDAIHDRADERFCIALQTMNRPTLITRYLREYYVTADGAVRATLDYQQRAYDQIVSTRPNLSVRLPTPDRLVVEVKAPERHAERVWDIVSRFPIRRSRNSKYALGMTAALMSR